MNVPGLHRELTCAYFIKTIKGTSGIINLGCTRTPLSDGTMNYAMAGLPSGQIRQQYAARGSTDIRRKEPRNDQLDSEAKALHSGKQ